MRFYVRFASCYGTLVLTVMLASFLTQSHIDMGWFGYYGFPLIAVIYAIVRYAVDENPVLFERHSQE